MTLGNLFTSVFAPWLKTLTIAVVCAILLPATFLRAAEIDMTARYEVSLTGNDSAQFINTTQSVGYCVSYPNECRSAARGSFRIPTTMLAVPLVQGQAIRQRVPRGWRKATVTHADGSTAEVELSIVGMGSVYTISNVASGQAGHAAVWQGGDWYVAIPGGCVRGTGASFTNHTFSYFWFHNSNNACVKIPNISMASVRFGSLQFVYDIKTPNPLGMSHGEYTGTLALTVGPQGDIELGNGAASDPILNVNFKLDVVHLLRVQFPVNSSLLALQPKGGWKQWLNSGGSHRPSKLMFNQPFRLWSSAKFNVKLQCEFALGDDCGLQSDKNSTQIPFKTRITLPAGIVGDGVTAASRYLLSASTKSVFHPTGIIRNARSELNFEVEKSGVDQMIDSGGGRFRGNVTMVFDFEI